MTQYGEQELVLPTLVLLDRHVDGLTTSELIALLIEELRPDGHDGEILANRGDTYFSQKVRNLVSHRTLVKAGVASYDAAYQHHAITPEGRRRVVEMRQDAPAPDAGGSRRRGPARFGAYRTATEDPATEPRQPFEVDPNEVDRGLGAHGRTQNALAGWVIARGLVPLSAVGGNADFDLAWEDGDDIWVAEVKSLTAANETGQLRLGLGQILHYQATLSSDGRRVHAVLAVEREPSNEMWTRLCADHGVALVWPDSFETLAAPPPDEGAPGDGPQ
jgi:hypothetical protein